MPDLRVSPIALIGGLNDSTAQPQPGDFQKLTNFTIYRGRIALRAPVTQTADITDVTITKIIGEFAYKSKLYVLAYYATGTSVRLYELNSDGTSPTYKADVWTALAAVPRPVIAGFDGGSESSPESRIYFADWDQAVATVYWNGTSIVNAQEDLNDDGTKENLQFHYVFTYNFHLFGAGFLQASVVRPELLRATRPGAIPQDEPYVVNNITREWWSIDKFPIGVPGDKIYAHGYAGGSAIVLKHTRTYALNGYDAQSFAVRQLSDKVGAVGRNAVCWTDDGRCFFWSDRGLMMTDGQQVIDLSEPIRGHLPAMDASNDEIILRYSADDGLVYIWYPLLGSTTLDQFISFNTVTMKYWEGAYIGSSPLTITAAGEVPNEIIPGPAAAPTMGATAAVSENEVEVVWVNGDTAYGVHTEIARDTATNPTTVVATVDAGVITYFDLDGGVSGEGPGLASTTDYYYRVRHTRGGQVSAWSANAQVRTWLAPETGLTLTPLVNGARLNWTHVEDGADIIIQRRVHGSGSFATIDTLLAEAAGAKVYDDTSASCGTSYDYAVINHKTGEHDSTATQQGPVLACWGGGAEISASSVSFSWIQLQADCADGITPSAQINYTLADGISGDTIKFYRSVGGGAFTLIHTENFSSNGAKSWTDNYGDPGAPSLQYNAGGGSSIQYKVECWFQDTTLSDTDLTTTDSFVSTC